jgi:hypothetical protein
MPATEQSLPYTLDAVLDAMRRWSLSLDISARPEPPSRFVIDVSHRLSEGVLTSGDTWRLTRAELMRSIAGVGGDALANALAASAHRVAETALGSCFGCPNALGGNSCAAVFNAMRSEIDDLQREHHVLSRSEVREASMVALSMTVGESLVSAATRLGLQEGVLGVVPFLPLLLAPHEPPRHVTAIELPYRLLLTPIENARWRHRAAPFSHATRTELWHTRLTTGSQDHGPDVPSKVRAIWSPDYEITDFDLLQGANPKPFRTSLEPLDRKMLVDLMAGYNARRNNGAYVPLPSRSKRLHLSSLGGLLDVEGNWDKRPTEPFIDLEQWRHLATLGRDHYVRVVYAGYLCPFGHSASLVRVTERKFESYQGDPDRRIAVLRQRYFIIVRERIKQYTGAHHEFHGNNFPFTSVEILTRLTPNLLPPGIGDSELVAVGGQVIYGGEIVRRMAFWPMIPSASGTKNLDFHFKIAATDLVGRRVTFTMPLLFLSEVVNFTKLEAARVAYNASDVSSRRTADLGSATVCYAPYDANDKGDARLPTDNMQFEAGKLTSALQTQTPNFYPETARARVGIPVLQKLLGRADAVVNVAYPLKYKQSGYGGDNYGQIFLQLVDAVHRLDFGGDAGDAKSDTLGALAAPQMSIQGLSRLMGPVAAQEPANAADPQQIAGKLQNAFNNVFDPTDFFRGAKILGGVDLGTIVAAALPLANSGVPKLLSRELLDRFESSFSWETNVTSSDPLNLLIPNAGAPTVLKMHGLVSAPLTNPTQTTFESSARINDFKVNLFGFIIIWFKSLEFNTRSGQKPDVIVELKDGVDAVQFGGPLEFVNTLREFIPSSGFSDPPSLTVSPSGIAASYSLSLPTISVGIFSLSNVTLGAGFNLPFDSRPASVQFRFSERQSPFGLTVSLFGGGGFFGIGVSARGVQEIEAALEFGAGVAIDLGVASGSVEVKAGVYFHWLEVVPDKGSVELNGYVRLHGELSVLGIISVSLTFNLTLGYLKEGGKSVVFGEATLEIEVEVLFFSFGVSITCRKEFSGSEMDPKFIDLIPDQDTWSEYCGAFAEEAA